MLGRVSLLTPGRPLPTALLLLALGAPPALADAAFLDRFTGSWRGSGSVLRGGDSEARKVSCSVEGQRSASSFSLDGTCRAALIFTRSIGADLRYDAGSDRFTGVYTGSSTGPAQLSGRLRGNSLVLAVDWGKPIFGDRNATMTITNAGNGSFQLSVSDEVEGQTVQTTNVSFQQR